MSNRRIRLMMLGWPWLIFALSSASLAQTYKLGAGANPQASTPAPSTQVRNNDAQPSSSSTASLGFGSNIQNARLARAAELALRNGEYSTAVDYAQRATRATPGDPQLWFLLGYASRLAGKLQLSLDAYQQGLRLNPSALAGLSGLAETYSATGRRDEAERILTQVLSANPNRAGDVTLLGELYVQSGDYEQALRILGRGERIEPSARTELLMAICYEHLKDLKQADHFLALAKRRAPDSPDIERSLAAFYRETGNYPAAIRALKAIAGKSPSVKAELAYTYQLSGKTAEAAKLYAESADAAPKQLGLQLAAAQAQVQVGTPEAAERFLKRAAALDSNHYRLHAIQGEIAQQRGRSADAVREYEAALSHLPQAAPEGPLYGLQLHMDLVDLDRELPDPEAARRHLEAAESGIASLDIQGAGRGQFLRLRALVKSRADDLAGAELDIREALAMDGKDPNTLELDGEVLAQLGRSEEAVGAYRKVLAIDPLNRFALTSLGYLSRQLGRDHEAEGYFERLAAADPTLYVPHLALGDLYTTRRDFPKAEAEYRQAYSLAPENGLIVAGGMNAAIEAHHFPLAAQWLEHATGPMQQEPQFLREKERYLNWVGEYQQSAEVGRAAIQKLPRDRDVIVYLGYDLLRLERYDDLQELISRYGQVLPKEPDLPLLAGYVHKHAGALEQAQADFTRVLELDPQVVTAYVNRGYVRNDLHQAAAAAADFESALRLEANDGEAHLGLAFASLALHHSRSALRQAQLAEQRLGDSLSLHLIRATAYEEQGSSAKAILEYRAALKYSPQDPGLHLALANALYGLHRYREAIGELQGTEKLSPHNAPVEAQLAQSYAHLGEREKALEYVGLAEQSGQTAVLVSTGEVLSLLGDRDGAIERFDRALAAADSNRISVRLAAARLMIGEGQQDDARRQIALGLMEARVGEASAPTPAQLMEIANLFLALHDYPLARSFFERARAAGGSDTAVRIGWLIPTWLWGRPPRRRIRSPPSTAQPNPN